MCDRFLGWFLGPEHEILGGASCRDRPTRSYARDPNQLPVPTVTTPTMLWGI